VSSRCTSLSATPAQVASQEIPFRTVLQSLRRPPGVSAFQCHEERCVPFPVGKRLAMDCHDLLQRSTEFPRSHRAVFREDGFFLIRLSYPELTSISVQGLGGVCLWGFESPLRHQRKFQGVGRFGLAPFFAHRAGLNYAGFFMTKTFPQFLIGQNDPTFRLISTNHFLKS
jgi:hypothetical protein